MMLDLPVSKDGVVYGHAYSVINAFEDESKQKWIVVRNPWVSFNATYKNDKLSLEMVDSKSQGYSVIRLEDFCHCCSSIHIINKDHLKSMNRKERSRKFTRKKAIYYRIIWINLFFIFIFY